MNQHGIEDDNYSSEYYQYNEFKTSNKPYAIIKGKAQRIIFENETSGMNEKNLSFIIESPVLDMWDIKVYSPNSIFGDILYLEDDFFKYGPFLFKKKGSQDSDLKVLNGNLIPTPEELDIFPNLKPGLIYVWTKSSVTNV
ncbi:hypothetical protein [Pseudoalteromonas sp. NGC95]|uniref:hypothetical protein n=1 Tax=Pseudoalteromonas sp. NGC95 TaxID=2792051 RepID=UPI0018CE4BAB|nr:hypothetical protein [Pseudoalteromonas sp. NGC95]MBH0017919.1 hypothetical protein [Pseudoalteromonas sp. NGC95]